MQSVRRSRRERLYKGPKRGIGILASVLLFPARMPKLRYETVDLLRKVCELSGVSLVLTLMVLMVVGKGAAVAATVIAAVIFVTSFMLIRLRMYQDNLIDHGYMS